MEPVDQTPPTFQFTPPIPIIAVLGDVENFTYYTSMQQWLETNPDRKSHIGILAHHLLFRVGMICVFTVADLEGLKRATFRYLLDYKPNHWQTVFPIDWTPELTNQYLDYIVESQMPLQIDVSRPESMCAEHRQKFFPVVEPYNIEYKRDIANVNSTYGEAPFRKKWEK
jgi:hypothetical protein